MISNFQMDEMKDGRTLDSEWKLLSEDWRGALGLAHVDSWAQALGVEQVGYLALQTECWQSANFWVSNGIR